MNIGCTDQTAEKNANLTESAIIQEALDTISEATEKSTEGKTFEEIGTDLMNSETIWGIKIGKTKDEVIKLIGYPDDKSTAEEWGSDGQIHQTWKYFDKNFELNLVGPENADQTVFSIYLVAPSDLKTSRKIGIGSSFSDVNSKYANEIDKSQSSEFSLVAGSPFAGIMFMFENKKLISIFIGASAE